MLDQLLHEILGFGGGKMFIERNNQKMSHTKRANQSDLVLRRGEQVRRFFGPQYFFRVRIKSDYHGCSIHSLSVSRRSRNDCLMPEMDPVENTYREKKRTGQLRKLRNRTENFHHNSLCSAHPGILRQTKHPIENMLSRRVFDLVDRDRIGYFEAA